MNLILLAAIVFGVTPQGARVTLANAVNESDRAYLGLSADRSWLWLGIDSDPLVWPKGQVLQVVTPSGRVVRARSLVLLLPDENLDPRPTKDGAQSLGGCDLSLSINDYAGARSRSTGKWNAKLFAGFPGAMSKDSVVSLQVGAEVQP